jgi:cell division protein FtsQ
VNALAGVLGRVAVPGRAAARVLRAAATRRPSPRVQRALVIAAAALALLSALYLLWFRDSAFVGVERVTVTGLDTRDAGRMRAALTVSARSMTTLHVDHDRLMRAVEGYPVVRELRVTSDFPHALRIEVVQHTPAAIAVSHGLRVPVAGDGTLLRGVPVEGRLPTIQVSGALPPERLRDPGALRQARVLGGAPAALRGRLDKVEESKDDGLTVEMRDGPKLIFGDATRVRAKWDAAARVLADPAARGASYVDVRLPDRPAAGGVAAETVTPVAPAEGVPAVPTDPAPTTTTPDQPAETTATAPSAEQAAPTAPEQTAPAAPPQQQPPAQPQQAPQAQAPPTQGTPGGGATANPQP